jgi:hypothetical protein
MKVTEKNSQIILKAVESLGYSAEITDSFGSPVVRYSDPEAYDWDEPESIQKVYDAIPWDTCNGSSWDSEGTVDIKVRGEINF